MTQPEKRSGVLLSALRDDLPTQQDEARIRRKLTTAGLTLGVATTAANLAQAAAVSTVEAASTSSAPAGVALSGSATLAAGKSVAVSKVGALVTTTWASLATGTKLAVVSVAIAGGAYPAVSHWNTRGTQTLPSAQPRTQSPATGAALTASASSAATWRASSTAEEAKNASPLAVQGVVDADGAPNRVGDSARAGRSSTAKAPPAPGTRAANGETVSAQRRGTSSTNTVGHDPGAQSSAPPTDVRLREETVLIERALVAARVNDKAAAARWLGEHEQRFPSGVLVRERERLRASLH